MDRSGGVRQVGGLIAAAMRNGDDVVANRRVARVGERFVAQPAQVGVREHERAGLPVTPGRSVTPLQATSPSASEHPPSRRRMRGR